MAVILHPTLEFDHVTEHPGRRRLIVQYDLLLEPGEPAVGHQLTERVVVRAVDVGDAPTAPRHAALLATEARFVGVQGLQRRTVEATLWRTDLDVHEDWWRAGADGAIEAIAEWVDHLCAEIAVSLSSELLVEATTPVLSGSWGALGRD
jgi:hypothetical protein